jgi:flavin reductase (DIM6/NTAB) family NADH-FMN oxidoreductase RutF
LTKHNPPTFFATRAVLVDSLVTEGNAQVFYDAIENKHGLKHDPFKALVVPRPIGWISTVSSCGICNLAPYSFFNAVGESPHYVAFGSAGLKDSLANIAATGEFVCSLATWDLRIEMNTTSAPVPSTNFHSRA